MQTLPLLLAQEAATEVATPYVGIAIASVLVVMMLLIIDFRTRAGTIARATVKETIRQPVFILMFAIGGLVTLANVFVPFFSMGDDTKMFIDCGLATVLICGMLLSIWTASLSVADEIEGKTAMTLLSKPINRQDFVLGKYLGILQASWLLVALLGILFFILTYYKFGYDQREVGQTQAELFYWRDVTWLPFQFPFLVEQRVNVALQIIPGLTLIAFEVAVMTAVSVAISTRMPMMVNVIACFAIFVTGHLTPVLVQSKAPNVIVKFVARLLATLLPALEHFNMQAAVSTGKMIPLDYIAWAGGYCLAYIIAMVLLAFILFEDRDLA